MKTKLILPFLAAIVCIAVACKKNSTEPAPLEKAKYLTQIKRINGKDTSVTNYTYDDKKRLTTIVEGSSKTTFVYSLEVVTYTELVNTRNGMVTSKLVNDFVYGDGKVLTKKSKYLDANGSLSRELGNGYAYDDYNKLTEWHQEGNVIFYEHDNDGNISKQKDPIATFTYTYDGKNSMFKNLKPEVKRMGMQIQIPAFYAKGNLLTSSRAGGTTTTYTYQYDSEGYPVSSTSGSSTYTYTYTML